jgi:hypothetical protein
MLWWLVGLWLASPALLPIFWLLDSVGRASRRVAERIMRGQRLHPD